MEKLLQDIRYSLRIMARSPSFVAAAAISLALGIGPNTMVFGLVNALLLKPLPVDKPEQLVRIFRSDERSPYHSNSYPDYLEYRDRQQSLSGLAASRRMMMSLNIEGQPEVVAGAVVSNNFFSVLGVRPVLGAAFIPESDQTRERNPAVIISYGLWQRQFAAASAVLGRTLKLNGYSFVVVGIAPKGFIGIDVPFATDLWVPIEMYPMLTPNGRRALDPISGRGETWLDLVGRLKPGVSLGQARSGLNVISAQIDSAYPDRIRGKRVNTLVPLGNAQPRVRTSMQSFAALLMVMVGLVWLIVCANVANLMLTRAAERRREIAVRLAIGAGRWRLVRQLLTESIALALTGGVLGVLLAYWASGLLLTFKPPVSIPITVDLSLDWRVLGFSLLASLLTGIVFGLAPALKISRPDLVPALKAEASSFGYRARGARLHGLFIVAQIALSLVLLIGAGLLFRSMRNAYRTDPGFEMKNLLLLSSDLNLRGYTESEGRRYYQRLIEHVKTIPGMRSASLTSVFPLSLVSSEAPVVIEGRESQPGGVTMVGAINVAPGYFETMGIPLIRGREFSFHDAETGPGVVIINQTMANRFWPGEDPIGKRINFDPDNPQSPSSEIVGIARDSKFESLGESPQPFVYMSIIQVYSPSITLVARAESDPETMLTTMRREAQSLDGDLPIFDVKTITTHLATTLFPLKTASFLVGLLGALAMLLAEVGLYGVVACSVALRTREFGIRIALGARSIQVLMPVLTQGAVLAMIGIGIGLGLALAAARILSSLGLLYGISAADPLTFFGVSLLLVSVAILASYLPARRATRIDPVAALRHDE